MLADNRFARTRTLECGFEEGVGRIRAALATHGFGVLTEIDLAGTLKKKLDADLPPYLILGACHPPSALRAVQAEPAVGLLLPCNVVVTVDAEQRAVIGVIDAAAMFSVAQVDGMDEVVADVRQRLEGALADA